MAVRIPQPGAGSRLNQPGGRAFSPSFPSDLRAWGLYAQRERHAIGNTGLAS